jgi:nitroimidazol reductase NimA-like FMN-containing flavoprotein (pyridoxamine 5'-phosphate oxidase superfamily)
VPVCVTVTLLDGLVLARSAFHHSMNYRSVVILGSAEKVDRPAEALAALEAIVEHVVKGRSSDVRAPSEKELSATTVLRLALHEASAKVRTGPPLDDEADYGLRCWAGVVPLSVVGRTPIPDPRLDAAIPAPSYVRSRG